MNRRQAGEDFHFLHKIVLLGEYGHVNDATVFPAARISHRVPFGTGASLKKWEEGEEELHLAYNLKIFNTLRPLFLDPGSFYAVDRKEWDALTIGLDPLMQKYIHQTGTFDRLEELKKNCADRKSFVKRFFHQLNAFWIIQYLNQCETSPGGKGGLIEESCKLLKELDIEFSREISARELLEIYRNLDRTSA
jgi:hypothetical protein